MSHKSFINGDSFIEVVFEGDIDHTSATELMGAMLRQTVALVDKGIPVNFLIDFTHAGKIMRFVKPLAVSGIRELKFRKMAGYGGGSWLEALANSIAVLSGQRRRTDHFKTREKAVAWLKS